MISCAGCHVDVELHTESTMSKRTTAHGTRPQDDCNLIPVLPVFYQTCMVVLTYDRRRYTLTCIWSFAETRATVESEFTNERRKKHTILFSALSLSSLSFSLRPCSDRNVGSPHIQNQRQTTIVSIMRPRWVIYFFCFRFCKFSFRQTIVDRR